MAFGRKAVGAVVASRASCPRRTRDCSRGPDHDAWCVGAFRWQILGKHEVRVDFLLWSTDPHADFGSGTPSRIGATEQVARRRIGERQDWVLGADIHARLDMMDHDARLNDPTLRI